MRFYEGIHIFGEGSMPCVHLTPENYRLLIEALLMGTQAHRIRREVLFGDVLETLQADVPDHIAVEYLKRIQEADKKRKFLDLFMEAQDTACEIGLVAPRAPLETSLVVARFLPQTTGEIAGKIRVGYHGVDDEQAFRDMEQPDLHFTRSLFSIIEQRDQNYTFI